MKVGMMGIDKIDAYHDPDVPKKEDEKPEWVHESVFREVPSFDAKFNFPQLFNESALAACFECGGKCGSACGCDSKCSCDGGNCGCDGGKGG